MNISLFEYPAVICIVGLICAILLATFINPYVIRMAYKKNLVDQPGQRKLQKRPIPVVGGVSIFFTIMAGISVFNLLVPTNHLSSILVGITIMFFIGFFDDMMSLTPLIRFMFQICTILVLWFSGDYQIDTFGGVFGVSHMEWYASIPFSILVGVGLINAFNMIDGVNGLASGLSIFTNTLCGVIFIIYGDIAFAGFAFIIVGALIPFFVCNVFSKKYKMFLGDSGSLIMGTLAYVYICKIIHYDSPSSIDDYFVAFLIALYSVPVFDTLRVMTMRMLKRSSPFKADRTHLHHIFVQMRMPHVIITFTILSINTVIVAFWFLLSLLHLDVTLHFLITAIVAASIIWSTYLVLHRIELRNPKRFDHMTTMLRRHEKSIYPTLLRISYIIDGHYFNKVNSRQPIIKEEDVNF